MISIEILSSGIKNNGLAGAQGSKTVIQNCRLQTVSEVTLAGSICGLGAASASITVGKTEIQVRVAIDTTESVFVLAE